MSFIIRITTLKKQITDNVVCFDCNGGRAYSVHVKNAVYENENPYFSRNHGIAVYDCRYGTILL